MANSRRQKDVGALSAIFSCCACLGTSGAIAIMLFVFIVGSAIGSILSFRWWQEKWGGINPAQAEGLLFYPTNCSAEAMAKAINSYIKEGWPTSPLNGYGADIVNAARKYGINPFLQAAQAKHENQFATIPRPIPGKNSTGCKNPFGIKGRGSAGVDGPATDSPGHYAAYATWEDGFAAHAMLIRRYISQEGLRTLSQIIHYYRTGKKTGMDSGSRAYLEDVLEVMDELYQRAGCTPTSTWTTAELGDKLVDIGGGFKLKSGAAAALQRAKEIAQSRGVRIIVTSAYRSPAEQRVLWNRNPNRDKVCGPRDGKFDHCPHVTGGAVDVRISNGDYRLLEDIMYEAGFVRYSHERWHFEYGTNRWKRAKELEKQTGRPVKHIV